MLTGKRLVVVTVLLLLAAVAFSWVNDSPTVIREMDMAELRTYVNAIRSNIGLSAYSWTDPTITNETPVKAAHYSELRTALEQVASTTGDSAPSWGDTISAGNPVLLAHLSGPRNNATSLNASINAKYCCGSYGGANTGSVGACPGTDDSGCGTISCAGWYLQSGTESPTATETCYNKASITSSRCEGLNDCKDANTADCSGQADSTLQYSCGTCKYISASSCTGTTLGSCSNYAAATDTGTCRECNGAGAEQTPGDDADCGTISCSGWYVQSGTESATATEYCYNKASITSSRCEGLGDCKDANTADCSGQADSTLQYSCGTCCYIGASACTSTTLGSCTNYGSGTQGPTADYYFTEGAASPTGTNYCKLRDYHCTGISCGETNDDSYVATCGTCLYATGACSSCTAYGLGTSCGTSLICSSGSCVAKATGGSVSYSGGYTIHTFTSSDTFTANMALSVEYLIVGGGGGGAGYAGGGYRGGGGGGGGVLAGSTSLGAGSYTVTVGAGGAGGAYNGRGSNGGNSAVTSISTATGGGGGAAGSGCNTDGSSGGSGGGAAASASCAGSGGAGTSGQGYAGGNSCSLSEIGIGAGGGGAGSAGTNGNCPTETGGNGGNGYTSSISGSSVTYAGGGRGGGTTEGSPGSGQGNAGGGGNIGYDPGKTGIVILRYVT